MSTDSIYSTPLDKLVDFNFDEKVASVFPDMINRSVPGYASIVSMTGVLAAEFHQPGSYCYDLGCSLGASSLSMAKAINNNEFYIRAIDNSQAMLSQAKEFICLESCQNRIELVCDDICNVSIENASVVVMNFTLQFIEPARRFDLLQNIYQGMRSDGILILSEKLAFNNAAQQQLLIDMYHYFKKANGYSELEINQKRQALEKVLIPETLEQHQQRLQRIGFRQVEQWFQCFNFSSLIAIK
mgnify:FL=1